MLVKMKVIFISSLLSCLVLNSCSTQSHIVPNTNELKAHPVDFEKMTGRWYEIARTPYVREDAWVFVSTDISRTNKEGTYKMYHLASKVRKKKVKNIRRKSWLKQDLKHSGNFDIINILGARTSFRVIYVDPAYQYALLTTASQKAIWILARNQYITQEAYQHLSEKVRLLGFDKDLLEITQQE